MRFEFGRAVFFAWASNVACSRVGTPNCLFVRPKKERRHCSFRQRFHSVLHLKGVFPGNAGYTITVLLLNFNGCPTFCGDWTTSYSEGRIEINCGPLITLLILIKYFKISNYGCFKNEFSIFILKLYLCGVSPKNKECSLINKKRSFLNYSPLHAKIYFIFDTLLKYDYVNKYSRGGQTAYRHIDFCGLHLIVTLLQTHFFNMNLFGNIGQYKLTSDGSDEECGILFIFESSELLVSSL
ncbi:hypothetical protein AGLY_009147 [Aphis glycines]|uniref:Uncharacterized protein n=1 Tax=Aphis glycines TaxID=307491 RepID=A0A6G0TIG0_APHGL|nr:hypothetical protein AGLY_009147 [Aphis glycines]